MLIKKRNIQHYTNETYYIVLFQYKIVSGILFSAFENILLRRVPWTLPDCQRGHDTQKVKKPWVIEK